jgi:tetratricopeptide (TPR) repeat protein
MIISKTQCFRLPLWLSLTAIFTMSLNACTNDVKEQSGGTLADVDISGARHQKKRASKADSKSTEEIIEAYYQYIDNAAETDSSRRTALSRLADLELKASNKMLADSSDAHSEPPEYNQGLVKTILLLETSLRDYPKAKDNDKVLYQLAQAYDRAGRYNNGIDTLKQLIRQFPRSLHYPEAQFRVGEAAFVQGNYISAEDAYTEVILTPGNDNFHEKSLFKRGWTRYKQQFYTEALDDYVEAIVYHKFDKKKLFSDSENTQFEEYFRALGLAFSYNNRDGFIRDYYKNRADFPFIYKTYASVSSIYLKQERYTDAAEILNQFTRYHPKATELPEAELNVIAAWQAGGFTAKLYDALERFYVAYQPQSDYWKKNPDEQAKKLVDSKLRDYIVKVSSYFHSRYQNKNSNADFAQAEAWYQRYLRHYSSYANKESIYSLYGELLLSANQHQKAIGYFELAAFDGDITLDKKSAYAAITLSNQLTRSAQSAPDKPHWLNKHLSYALKFIELYPLDKRSQNIAVNAAQFAFQENLYKQAIQFASHIADNATEKARFIGNNIKAQSYLALEQYADAEAIYLELLESKSTTRKQIHTLYESIALVIFRQAENSEKDNDIDMAIYHFTRIAKILPTSKLAATGTFDAIALTMRTERWNQAIALIDIFSKAYPKHPLGDDVTKKLSVAYLNSNQKGKAAQEFERIAKLENNVEVKMAALWQAAELYEAKNDRDGAIRAYRSYANTYSTPYAPYMESMHKLSSLYDSIGDRQKSYFWRTRIRTTDAKATKRVKTDRTQFIASSSVLILAQQKQAEYSTRKLVEPLALSLRKKKSAMQESVKLYGQASTYGIAEITTEATYAIGSIYNDFSRALLTSERPKNLNSDELEQYQILIEDQAFPFEEKAIEFYETNLARVNDSTYTNWIQESFDELLVLFPVRYDRKGKINAY